VSAALAEADQRDIGALTSRHGGDVFDLDRPSDHLMTQAHHDRRHTVEPLRTLVRNQDAQVLRIKKVAHAQAPSMDRETLLATVWRRNAGMATTGER
jgi:hypothetical protein